MTNRSISPVANLVASALRVPWARPWILRYLRAEYVAAGTQAALASRIGVSLRAVETWLADPGVREHLTADTARPWHCGACGHETRGEPDSCPMCGGGGGGRQE